ncbi:MAG: Holliday junction resolvase RuvX [Rickettsiales bacterium]|jgi:putative Holliday junction resolvase|nr:Holliday junction resolvase RuvX [Rickettsiales bacterium]
MIFEKAEDFIEKIEKNARLLGVDFGCKNIGLAVSDRGLTIAVPKTIIPRQKNSLTIQNLRRIIAENGVSGIVFGLPLNSEGKETAFCKNIRNFVNEMCKAVDIPIFFYDEFLTSDNAKSMVIDELGGNFRTAKKNLDKISAALLLGDFLEKIKLRTQKI